MYIPENWSNIQLPGLRKVFTDVYKEQASNIAALFSMQTSQKAQEFDLLDDAKSEWTEFVDKIDYSEEIEGYKATYTHKEFVNGKKIQRRLLQDDLYGVIKRKPAQMAIGGRRKRETDGMSVFNNAFNASVTGPDGVSLCNTAHPSKQVGVPNRSNTSTLPFSALNVETTRQAMIGIRDGSNQIISIQPDMLIVPTALAEKAYELISSAGKVDTANNNRNFHQGKYKLLVIDNYFTSNKNWFMVDSTYMKQFLLWFDREPVQFFKDQDFGILAASFAGYMRYSYGWSDFPWIWGNNPA